MMDQCLLGVVCHKSYVLSDDVFGSMKKKEIEMADFSNFFLY